MRRPRNRLPFDGLNHCRDGKTTERSTEPLRRRKGTESSEYERRRGLEVRERPRARHTPPFQRCCRLSRWTEPPLRERALRESTIHGATERKARGCPSGALKPCPRNRTNAFGDFPGCRAARSAFRLRVEKHRYAWRALLLLEPSSMASISMRSAAERIANEDDSVERVPTGVEIKPRPKRNMKISRPSLHSLT